MTAWILIHTGIIIDPFFPKSMYLKKGNSFVLCLISCSYLLLIYFNIMFTISFLLCLKMSSSSSISAMSQIYIDIMAKFLSKNPKPYLKNRNLISLLYLNASSNYNAGHPVMQFLWLFKPRIRSLIENSNEHIIWFIWKCRVRSNYPQLTSEGEWYPCQQLNLPAMGQSLKSLSPATNILQPRGTNSAELVT